MDWYTKYYHDFLRMPNFFSKYKQHLIKFESSLILQVFFILFIFFKCLFWKFSVFGIFAQASWRNFCIYLTLNILHSYSLISKTLVQKEVSPSARLDWAYCASAFWVSHFLHFKNFFFSMRMNSNRTVHAHGFTVQETKCIIHALFTYCSWDSQPFYLEKNI